ncbi:MAG: type I-C CRISPR-associated protein Cas5 [Hyphomonas sp.]|uniref:type I-C CRISPR-associated protein Cas5c n=1 Tax=Hyphomonas sp. TaxID=87 RepID=UPI001822CFA5|nr:type I-C CRISPR-associated protein Cas5c [Hyphomonas sp.]MBA3068793.1 type I-C CRISPR-associated protein Cas5 [Hyphomonas sp.]MBU3921553.1 type I-C CRISPR-associated protein Cas5c [Alphaproteobacteria bacterium]MBU4060505.1 type I-C CRISPR-associated protein Cas5c [Alphaproteobacteria bacterium]MBU4162875.1 type I-C CRISPR-associated protein Cas5c [Alphaproteobacteria bacterium]
MTYGVKLLVTGPRACFTRPEMKVERVSYDVMTPSAARGILEAIHWKPAISWVIDAVHVLRPIRFQSFRRNEVGSKAPAGSVKQAMNRGDLEGLQLIADEDRQQRAASILTDVAYVIAAHFVLTPKAGADDNEGKHLDTFNRRAARGQCFHQPCLGTREFDARFELLEPAAHLPQPDPAYRTPELGFGVERDLGIMLWDIAHQEKSRPSMFFRARLEDGVMRVPQPGSAEVLK